MQGHLDRTLPLNAAARPAARFSRTRVLPYDNAVRTPTPVRWMFLLFVFSLPFDALNYDLPFIHLISLPRFAGLLFFGAYLLYYGPLSKTRRLPRIPLAMWGMLAYLAIVVLNVFFVPAEYLGDLLIRIMSLIQLTFLFWIAVGLFKDFELTRAVFLTVAIASAVLSIGNLLQLPGFYQEFESGRITGIGDNPNSLATDMAVGIVAALGLVLCRAYRNWAVKSLLLCLTAPVLIVLASTGSRGGVLAFGLGCAAYLIPRRGRGWLISVLVGTLLIGAATYAVLTSPTFVERWDQTIKEGDMAGREDIFAMAEQMILERPVFGWHFGVWFYELGNRVNSPNGKDAHNLFLAVLLEVGLLGAAPFCLALCVCAKAAWRARVGTFKLLPLALLLTVITAGLSGTTLVWKTQWLTLAFVVAAPTKSEHEDRQATSGALHS